MKATWKMSLINCSLESPFRSLHDIYCLKKKKKDSPLIFPHLISSIASTRSVPSSWSYSSAISKGQAHVTVDIWPICTCVKTVGFRDVFQGGVATLPTIHQPFSGSLKRKPFTLLACHSHLCCFLYLGLPFVGCFFICLHDLVVGS